MVRGLYYYTRTAFEVVSYQLGSQNAVTGGGRYDDLFKDIGGLDVPGIGFAIGMERLISLLPKDKEFIQYPHLFIAALDEENSKKAYELINQLHLEGIPVELDYEGKSLKSQMRRADKLKARYVLIVGEEELKKGRAVLRKYENQIPGGNPNARHLGYSEVKNFSRLITGQRVGEALASLFGRRLKLP